MFLMLSFVYALHAMSKSTTGLTTPTKKVLLYITASETVGRVYLKVNKINPA